MTNTIDVRSALRVSKVFDKLNAINLPPRSLWSCAARHLCYMRQLIGSSLLFRLCCAEPRWTTSIQTPDLDDVPAATTRTPTMSLTIVVVARCQSYAIVNATMRTTKNKQHLPIDRRYCRICSAAPEEDYSGGTRFSRSIAVLQNRTATPSYERLRHGTRKCIILQGYRRMSCRIRARGFDGSKATLPELNLRSKLLKNISRIEGHLGGSDLD